MSDGSLICLHKRDVAAIAVSAAVAHTSHYQWDTTDEAVLSPLPSVLRLSGRLTCVYNRVSNPDFVLYSLCRWRSRRGRCWQRVKRRRQTQWCWTTTRGTPSTSAPSLSRPSTGVSPHIPFPLLYLHKRKKSAYHVFLQIHSGALPNESHCYEDDGL